MIRRIQCLWRGHDDNLISGLVSALHYSMFGVNNLDTFVRYDQKNKNRMEIYSWKCNHCGRLRSATEDDVRESEKDPTAPYKSPSRKQ